MNIQPPPVPVPPSYPSTGPRKDSFSIHWLGWVCYGIGLLIVLTISIRHSDRTEANTSYLMGMAFGMLVLSILPALLAFYIGRRSRMAATITFIVMLVLAVFGQVSQAQKRSLERGAFAALDARVQEAKATVTEQVNSPDGFDGAKMLKTLDGLAASANQAAGSVRGPEAAQLRALSGFLNRLGQEMQPFQAAATAMQEKSPLLPSWVMQKSDLEEARVRINGLRKANEELRSFFARADLVLKQEMDKEKVPARAQEQALSALNQKFANAKPRFATLRRQDDELCTELLKVDDLLETNWGKWRFDPESQTVIFDSDEVVAEYNKIHQRVLSLAEEQAQTQRAYVEAMK